MKSVQSSPGTLTAYSPAWHSMADSLRSLGSHLMVGMIVSLVGLVACWCCGYGAYAAWSRTGPSARHRRGTTVDLALAEETERGIAEIEAYLARAGTAPEAPLPTVEEFPPEL